MLALALAAVLAGAPPAGAAKKPAPVEKAPRPSERLCQVYPRRCEDGCKQAHMKASTETCFEAQKAIFQAIPDVKKATECLMACDKSRGLGCVGPPDQAGCDCQMACYQAMPAAAQEKAKAAADCYEKAVGPACR